MQNRLGKNSSQLAAKRNWPQLVQLGFALLVAIMAGFAGQSLNQLGRFDEELRAFRESRIDRPATGQIHLVEIDARSLSQTGKWPWPRSLHAALVDQLGKAGAETIAFDIDFSSHSTLVEDNAFSAALNRFDGTVILPTFRQNASALGDQTIDSEPIPAMREYAILASVNVSPDADGVMRHYSNGSRTTGIPRPSMPVMLAGGDGEIDGSFWISNSIKPQSIPRHSAVDIINGTFDKDALKGKTVLIGATAIEMGDRYATQAYGVQSGVVIQAMAAETLTQQLNLRDYGALPLAMLALLLCITMGFVRSEAGRTMLALGGLFAVMIVPFSAEYFKLGTFGVTVPMMMLVCTYAALRVQRIIAGAYLRRMTDADTALPNMLSLKRDVASAAGSYLFVFNISNLSELSSMLGNANRAELYDPIIRRIKVNDAIDAVYLTDNGGLAWICPVQRVEDARAHAEAICALFLSAIHPLDHAMVVEPTIGIDRVDGKQPGTAIRNALHSAEIASDRACKWLVHTQAVSESSGLTQLVLSEIDNALLSGDIHFMYQPKLSLHDGHICGAEALVRWNHRDLGPLSPNKFVPILEKHGRMSELTLHGISAVEPILRQLHHDGRDQHIAVNISAPLLADSVFEERLIERLISLGNARSLLTLEVTESASAESNDRVIPMLHKIKAMGCKISIDDYGTGNSTLSYLKDFAADEIKIDQRFITNIASSKNDQALVMSTIDLAHKLDMTVVAEGIEDVHCATVLKQMGCDIGQGWHFAKPMALNDLLAILGDDVSLTNFAVKM